MIKTAENTSPRQLIISDSFNNRLRTTNFNQLSTQKLIELSFNLKPSKAVELLESIDALTDLKNVLTSFPSKKVKPSTIMILRRAIEDHALQYIGKRKIKDINVPYVLE